MHSAALILLAVVSVGALRVPTAWDEKKVNFKKHMPKKYNAKEKKWSKFSESHLGNGIWHQFLNGKENINFGPGNIGLQGPADPIIIPEDNWKSTNWKPGDTKFDSLGITNKDSVALTTNWKNFDIKSTKNKSLEDTLKTLQEIKNKKSLQPNEKSQINTEETKKIKTLKEPPETLLKPSETIIPQDAKKIEEDIPDLSLKASEDGVPTRPIYPGEGVWAKPGLKHRPYIKPEDSPKEEEDEEDDVLAETKKETPGDAFFDKASEDFAKQSDNFSKDLKTLQTEDFKTKQGKPAETQSEDDEEDEEDDFVPLKTYSQVRKYENSEHLPASVLEPRLKEVVRDSVIHTVYTEEGYEDSGYDHAGHEKNAENNEGHEEYDESKKEPQVEASSYVEPNFAQTAVTKTTQVKENATGGMEYEVSSKMKIKLANSKSKPEVTYSTSKPEIDAKTAEFIMADISKHFSRKKRFVNDFPKIEVDTSFIDKIGPPQFKILPTTEKYPYYNMQNLNKNSPLRYAQDIRTIPIKTEDKMAVYDRNDGLECEDVQDPEVIPKHIDGLENGKEKEEIKEEDREEPKTPRLTGLGDKIDCFKLKYFGVEPLDSPIFKEEEIGAPEPIFEELKPKSSNVQINYDQNWDASKQEENIIKDEIKLKPKIVYYSKRTLSPRQARSSPFKASERFSRSSNADSSLTTEKSAPISSSLLHNSTKSDNSTEISANSTKPEQQALRIIIKTPRRKYPQIYATIRKDKFPPRYPLGPPPGYTYNYKTSTVPPKQNTLSEVFYKDEIKPSEQMNVFADIINNIKNSSLQIEEEQSFRPSSYDVVNNFYSTSTRKPPVDQSVVEESMDHVLIAPTPSGFEEPFPYRKKKYPMYKVHEQIYDDFPRKKISILAKPPIPHFLKPQVPNISKPPLFDDNISKPPFSDNISKPQFSDNILKPQFYDNISQPPMFDVSKPTPLMKKIIPIEEGVPVSYQINPVTSYTTLEVPLNKYYVPGMKPPPSVEKPFIYADYKMKNPNLLTRRYALLRRHKRSPARYSYSEIRRPSTKKPEEEEEEEEEDDYVPHRPTNYHYDPGSDKIIYKTTTGGPHEIEEIEIEEEEDDKEEPVVVKTTTRRTVYHKDVLNKENGLTLVDFLEKLRANPAYVAIPDPEPTEKTTTTTTTISPDKTTPPAFLGFLAQLHSAESYVKIEDEDEKAKSKPKTTTTAAPEEEEEEEEDEVVQGNVQNSPGGQFNNRQDFQLFDISEYLPKTKTYSPRTSIDYSKYKTIERTTARHNLSSKYNEEEDTLPLRGDNEEENSSNKSNEDRRKGYEEIRRKYNNEDRRKNHKEDSEEDNTENRRNIYNEDRRKNHKDDSEENNDNRKHLYNGDRRITQENSEDNEEDSVAENLAEANSFLSTSTTTTTTTTTIKPTTRQRRRRPTTTTPKSTSKPTRSTTYRPSPSSTARIVAIRTRPSTTTVSYKESEEKYTPATHRAPTRVYPRRPRPSLKIRLRTTTEDSVEEVDDKEEAESQNRRVRKLDDYVSRVPANHKAFYSPIVVEDQEEIVETQKQPRLITPDIISYNKTKKGDLRESIDRKLDIEVFKDYDAKQRHGGNYVYENPSFEEEMKQVVKYIDNVPRFYGGEKSKGDIKSAENKEATFSGTNYEEAKPNVRFANKARKEDQNSSARGEGRFQITAEDEDEGTNKEGYVEATTRRPNNIEARRLAAMRFKANRKGITAESNTDNAKTPDYAKARRIAASRFRSSSVRKEEPKPSTEDYEEVKARRLLPIIEARRLATSRFKANRTPSSIEGEIQELKSGTDAIEKRGGRNLDEGNNETRLEDRVGVVDEDEVKINFGTTTKRPLIIKDPSKRLYYYAPL